MQFDNVIEARKSTITIMGKNKNKAGIVRLLM